MNIARSRNSASNFSKRLTLPPQPDRAKPPFFNELFQELTQGQNVGKTGVVGCYSCCEKLEKKLAMTTHFITAEIDVQDTPVKLKQAIETELEKRGEPLRWAVTSVEGETQKAQVEAIVTTEDSEGLVSA